MSNDTVIEPPKALSEAVSAVRAALAQSAHEGLTAWSDQYFFGLSEQLWQAQITSIDAYATWCEKASVHSLLSADTGGGRSVDGRAMLPVSAMKQLRVAAHDPASDSHVWESSTTTADTPSRHHLPNTELYDMALLAGARAALIPEGADLSCIQLVPTSADMPNSSLAHMCDEVRTNLCASGEVFATCDTHESGAVHIDTVGVIRALQTAEAHGQPVLLLTTSFALVHLIDCLDNAIKLPTGSRVMDTGGFKGRSREVERSALLADVTSLLGVPAEMCENEYGMSELSSQCWLGSVAHSVGDPLPDTRALGTAWPHNQTLQAMPRWQPPWMRSYVLDPVSLKEVPDGELGLLAHIDLANAYTCAFLRTDDLARRVGNSFELLGRAPEAELRGCSLLAEDLLAATRVSQR